MNPLRQHMPAMLRHEGWWDGHYRHFDADGTLVDIHRTRTHCEFPDSGDEVYLQHNWLEWADGRTSEYHFGGRFEGGFLVWDTDRFHGRGWQTHEDVLMLRLARRDVPDAYYIEMITIAPDGQRRARTWQWYRGGVPWKRTLCDEWRTA